MVEPSAIAVQNVRVPCKPTPKMILAGAAVGRVSPAIVHTIFTAMLAAYEAETDDLDDQKTR